MRREHPMPFGAQFLPGGGARLRLWAPDAQRVELMLGATALPMQRSADGWHETTLAQAAPGLRYAYRIDGKLTVPDPASRSNPDDVHAASALVDPKDFDWPDAAWKGRPWHEAVIYELHVGCFTPAGTFGAAIDRLDDLVALGVTAIELMPVADFPGRRGWGYDGVLPFAPDASYGTPQDLKRLVAAAHERGLMVLLDVVYNHFGPDGNYLHAYASAFFNPAVATPWGAAVNFDAEGSRTVRDFFIHNALYWLEEFHVDGLRIDAVHAMHDGSKLHFVDELARAVHDGPGRTREVHLVLENDRNDAAHLRRGADGRPRLATAQWNDDVHHALHVLATGEADGYYADFAARPLQHFGRALAQGFAWQGEMSALRGAPHGTPSRDLPPLAFVNSLQTHDQVGNRAFGERIAMLASADHKEDALRALLACVLLSPAPPMLFMGEEFAADTPFLYFCDFSGELARAVTEGRRSEFSRFERFADPAVRGRIPDPNDESTFLRSKLDWAQRSTPRNAAWLGLYTLLLELRREALMPLLPRMRSGEFELGADGLLRVHWPIGSEGTWHLTANLSSTSSADVTPAAGRIVFASRAVQGGMPPWSAVVSVHRP